MRTLRATATFSDSSVFLVQETEPVHPAKNTVWVDTEGNARRWNGEEWVNVTDLTGYVKEEYLTNEFFQQQTTKDGITTIIGNEKMLIGKENVTLVEAINTVTQTATETKSLISGFSLNSGAKVFTSKPTPPYSENDLWYDSSSSTSLTKICVKSRSSGRFTSSDWKTIDDTISQRVYMAFSMAEQTKDKFEWIVSGGTSSSNMTLTNDMLKIVAKNIDLEGNAVFASLTDVTNGVTTIDGGKIKAGTISADSIDVEKLFAKDITMTGTLTSYYSDNTAQLTIGDGKIQMYTKNSGFSGIEIKRDKLESDCKNDYPTVTSLRSDFIDIAHQDTSDRIAIGRVVYRDGLEKALGIFISADLNNHKGFIVWDTGSDGICDMELNGSCSFGKDLTVSGKITTSTISASTISASSSVSASTISASSSVSASTISASSSVSASTITASNNIKTKDLTSTGVITMKAINKMGCSLRNSNITFSSASNGRSTLGNETHSNFNGIASNGFQILTVNNNGTLIYGFDVFDTLNNGTCHLYLNGDGEFGGDMKAKTATITNSLSASSATVNGALSANSITTSSATVNGALSANSIRSSSSLSGDTLSISSGTVTNTLTASTLKATNKVETSAISLSGRITMDDSDGFGCIIHNDSVGFYNLGTGGRCTFGNEVYGIQMVTHDNGNYRIGFEVKDTLVENKCSMYLNGNASIDGNLTATGVSSSSDARLKHEIEDDVSKYENFFMSLQAKSWKYDWSESDRRWTGFIAQEVEQALLDNGLTNQDFAGIVIQKKTEDDTDWLGVEDEYRLRYESFVSLNTHMIQKNIRETETLRKENEELKEELKELREMVTSLVNKEE